VSAIIVDASVGVKWFVPEDFTPEACQLQVGQDELHVPATFFNIEIANILWKKIRRAEMTRVEADRILTDLPNLQVTRHAEGPLLLAAFNLADQTKRTVYDCLYLALAMKTGGRMVTADLRLYNSLANTLWAHYVLWIGHFGSGP
jgi:predicted nucleic acid-binding protein